MLLGNKTLLQKISYAFHTNRFPKNCIITGSSGIGKSLLSQYIASYILHAPKESFFSFSQKPCPVLDRNPDMIYIAPENGTINIQHIRNIKQFFSLKPHQHMKILQLKHTESMTNQATNAFLQILEEGNGLYILTSTFPKRIPSTILSRSLILSMQPISSKDIRIYLESNGLLNHFSINNQKLILLLAHGSLGIATQLVKYNETFINELQKILFFLYCRKNLIIVHKFFMKTLQEDSILFPNITLSLVSFLITNQYKNEFFVVNINQIRCFIMYERLKSLFLTMNHPTNMNISDIVDQIIQI